MLTIIQYPLEAGILIALAMYGLILAWVLLARLDWLPGVVARPVRHLLNRLGRLPVLGRAVTATRRHPLSLGLATAILVGITVPMLLISVYVLFSVMAVCVVMYVAFRYGDFDVEMETEPDPNRLYFSKYSGELVLGSHPDANPDEPHL
jgi:hypothetical protein